MFFELVSILLAFVPDYGNEYTTKENKNWTSFKHFAPKLNLNHNIYTETRRVEVYHDINRSSPTLRGIVVLAFTKSDG